MRKQGNPRYRGRLSRLTVTIRPTDVDIVVGATDVDIIVEAIVELEVDIIVELGIRIDWNAILCVCELYVLVRIYTTTLCLKKRAHL